MHQKRVNHQTTGDPRRVLTSGATWRLRWRDRATFLQSPLTGMTSQYNWLSTNTLIVEHITLVSKGLLITPIKITRTMDITYSMYIYDGREGQSGFCVAIRNDNAMCDAKRDVITICCCEKLCIFFEYFKYNCLLFICVSSSFFPPKYFYFYLRWFFHLLLP